MDENPIREPDSPGCTVCIAHAEGLRGPCYLHSPERAEERSRNNARAARSKGGGILRAIDKELRELIREVWQAEVSLETAAVLNRIINTRLRLVEIERKAEEHADLQREFDELREQLDEQRSRAW